MNVCNGVGILWFLNYHRQRVGIRVMSGVRIGVLAIDYNFSNKHVI
jgi:hypothetical protein